jgi:hypothetical protein
MIEVESDNEPVIHMIEQPNVQLPSLQSIPAIQKVVEESTRKREKKI